MREMRARQNGSAGDGLTATGQQAMRRLTTVTESDRFILLPQGVYRRAASKHTHADFVLLKRAANVSS